ncbi:choice-of-anchor D domain-containing protein [Vulgatibacter sp.]|uniref:choice-of-anchor D domain-containing protein n=1 Tax=Vulgatibacter sp. TaxID=1971226 RepID=UPI0035655383
MIEKDGMTVYVIPFDAVAVNDRGERTVELRNDGSAAMTVQRPLLDSPFGSDISANGVELAPGAVAPITLFFSPTEAGDFEKVAELPYSGGSGKAKIGFQLTGRGVVPSFSCVPEEVDFGKVEIGEIAKGEVTCTNNTELETLLTADKPSGADREFFTYSAIPPEGVLVPAGTPIRIPVSYNAASRGERLAHFTLYAGRANDEDRKTLKTIRLRGEGITSAIEVSADCANNGKLDFGYVPPGAKLEKTFTIRNVGSSPLNVSNLALEGASSPAFTIKSRTPIAIPSDDPATPEKENEAEIAVEFAPLDLGSKMGTIQITNSSNGTPVARACLQGYGGGPIISCSPSTIDFGPVAVGIPGDREYVCTNAGTDNPVDALDNLFVESVVSGADEFTALIENADGTNGPKTAGYAVGEFFTVHVRYEPIDDGFDSTGITIFSNDQLTPEHLTTVQGEGRELPPCDFTIVPPELRFGIVAPGRSATLEFAIRNNLDTECLVRNVRVEDAENSAFSVDPVDFATLPGSGELRFPVTFNAPERVTGDGLYTGNVLFDISNPDTPNQVVPLRGAAAEPCAIIAPDHLDFGTVAPGCSTRERYFTIINICDEPLVLSSIELNAGAAQYPCEDDFDGDGTVEWGYCNEFGVRQRPTMPGTTLARGAQAEFTMVYMPGNIGEDLGSVFVTVDGAPEPYMATLQGRGANDALQTDTFSQDDRPKVDLLWVIDNSGSMSPFQTAVAQNLTSFLSFAVAQQIDFQLGVTTTGITTSGGCPGGVNGGENGRLFPVIGTTPRILTPQTQDLEEAWSTNVQVGLCHGSELGLEAAYRALSSPLVDNADDPRTSEPNDGNLGFLRRDANLSIVFLSDEEDQSPETVSFYYNFFMSIKGFRNSNMFSAHSIAGDPVTGCNGGSGYGQASPRYYGIAEMSNGVFQSICTQDWSTAMERIGTNAFGFKTRFFLTNQPEDTNADGVVTDRGTNPEIEVRINGVRVPSINSRGTRVWEYVPDVNAIDFYPLSVPEPGSEIEVTYKVACL